MNLSPKITSRIIFTDAATSSKFKVAVGVYLCLDSIYLDSLSTCSDEVLASNLFDQIVCTRYASKKSTWSEIKTVIDALSEVLPTAGPDMKVAIYTDCQSLCDLLGRRKEKLERNNFITKAGKVLENASLYRELFELADKLQIKTFKIKGHHSTTHHLTIHDKIFAILDKLSRAKLRSIVSDLADQ
jgi:ribonuclease HI